MDILEEQGKNQDAHQGIDKAQSWKGTRSNHRGTQSDSARLADVFQIGGSEEMVQGNREMATSETAVLSLETVQKTHRNRKVSDAERVHGISSMGNGNVPQWMVAKIAIRTSQQSHGKRVVQASGIDTICITEKLKPRSAIKGTLRGVRGGENSPYSIGTQDMTHYLE